MSCFLPLIFGIPLPASSLLLLSLQNISQETALTIPTTKSLFCHSDHCEPSWLLSLVSPGPSLHKLNRAAPAIPSELMSDSVYTFQRVLHSLRIESNVSLWPSRRSDHSVQWSYLCSRFQLHSPPAVLCSSPRPSAYSPFALQQCLPWLHDSPLPYSHLGSTMLLIPPYPPCLLIAHQQYLLSAAPYKVVSPLCPQYPQLHKGGTGWYLVGA